VICGGRTSELYTRRKRPACISPPGFVQASYPEQVWS